MFVRNSPGSHASFEGGEDGAEHVDSELLMFEDDNFPYHLSSEVTKQDNDKFAQSSPLDLDRGDAQKVGHEARHHLAC